MSTSLPNLSRLSLHCAPCGKPFERWQDALKDEESKKHPNYKFWGRDDICGICRAPLEDKADLGDETYDVEALIEELKCGHVFHSSCLQESIKNGVRICPMMDRTPIAQEVLKRLAPDANAIEGEDQRLGVYDSGERGSWYNETPPEARANNPERQAQLEEAETDVEEEAASAYFDGDLRMVRPLRELGLGFNRSTPMQILSAIADLITDEGLDDAHNFFYIRQLLEHFLQRLIEAERTITRLPITVTNGLKILLGGIYYFVTHTPTGRMGDSDFIVERLYHRLGPKPNEDDGIRRPRSLRMREIISWLATNIYRSCIGIYDVTTYGPLATMKLGSIVRSRLVVLIDDAIKNKFDIAYLLRMHPACVQVQIAKDFINDQTIDYDDERKRVMKTWFWLYYRILFKYELHLNMNGLALLEFRNVVTRGRIEHITSRVFEWGDNIVAGYMHTSVADFWTKFTQLDTGFVAMTLQELAPFSTGI